MDSGKRIKRAGRVIAHVALLGVVIIASGCPFVVPTAGIEYGAPGKDVVRKIEAGVTTRADVLMMLGDPNFRIEDDRYFVYDWSETHALYGMLLPGGGVLLEGVRDLHALALEFGVDGGVTRFEQFLSEGAGEKMAEQALWGRIRAWIKNADAAPR